MQHHEIVNNKPRRTRSVAASGQSRKLEGEARVEQPAGDDPAALQQQLGVGAQDERAELGHPSAWRAARPAPRQRPAAPHEVALGQRPGAARLTGPARSSRSIRKLDRADEVAVMDPGDVLPAARDRAAEARAAPAASSTSKMPPRSGLMTMAVRSATLRGPRCRRLRLRALPRLGDVDAVRPVGGRVRLGAADDPGGLVVGRVEAVRVDRGRAHLQPDPRRPCGCRDGLADRRASSRPASPSSRRRFAGGVAAVDAAPGQVDHRVGAVDLRGPGADRAAVPPHDAGRRSVPPRLSTTTSCASDLRSARRSHAPTCPVPPGITIFMNAPLEVERVQTAWYALA